MLLRHLGLFVCRCVRNGWRWSPAPAGSSPFAAAHLWDGLASCHSTFLHWAAPGHYKSTHTHTHIIHTRTHIRDSHCKRAINASHSIKLTSMDKLSGLIGQAAGQSVQDQIAGQVGECGLVFLSVMLCCCCCLSCCVDVVLCDVKIVLCCVVCCVYVCASQD